MSTLALGLRLNAARGPRSLIARALSAIRRNNGTALYVPDNYAGAFVDSTGTQPVTAVNDLVGLLTDRSYGAGNLGVELALPLTAGGGWGGNGAPGVAGGSVTLAPGQQIECSIPATSGKLYKVAVTLSGSPSFTNIYVGGTGNFGVGTGAKVLHVVSGGTGLFIIQSDAGAAGPVTVSAVSVREVLGNHASQPTTASKPLVTQLANGTKVMDFDASNDSLTIGIVTGGTPWVRTYTTAGTVTTYTSATTTQIVMGQPQLAGRRVVLMVASNAAITGADLTTIERLAVSRGAVL